MNALAPLQVLFDPDCGVDVPLPDDLKALYGRLQFPSSGSGPHVIGNFVTTLDGVVSLGIPGTTDGNEISGSNRHDSMVMGLLRSASDAVIIGAGTLRQSPDHIWTPEFVFPGFGGPYSELRKRLGRHTPPLCAVVTAGGLLDLSLPVFRERRAPVAVVTTTQGETVMRRNGIPPGVQVLPAGENESLTVREILDAVVRCVPGGDLFLVEGGPRLIGQFLDRGELDELFLTLSPRLAGRDGQSERPGLISGNLFLPDRVLAGKLNGVRRAESHLFLRYSFHVR